MAQKERKDRITMSEVSRTNNHPMRFPQRSKKIVMIDNGCKRVRLRMNGYIFRTVP